MRRKYLSARVQDCVAAAMSAGLRVVLVGRCILQLCRLRGVPGTRPWLSVALCHQVVFVLECAGELSVCATQGMCKLSSAMAGHWYLGLLSACLCMPCSMYIASRLLCT